MANIKITDLQALNNPKNTDVLPIVDISADETKKVSIADLLENAGEGSVTNAAFAFDGDPNTGMYHPSDDVLGFTAGGTQALRVESTGVIVPGNLTVEGTTTTIETTNLVIEDKNIQLATVTTPTNTTADGGGITLKGATDKTITWVNSTGCWTFNQPMNFNDHVRIDSSGNTGIGTTNPTQKLHVIGNQIFEGDMQIFPQNTGGEGGQITLRNPDKTTTGAAIDISSANVFRIFQLNDNSVMELGQLAGTGGFIKFVTEGSERMRIVAGGNVGVGTSAPQSVFHTNGTRDYTGTTPNTASYDINFQSGTAYVSIGQSNGCPAIQGHGSGTSYNLALAPNNGNVGIGNTAPGAKLQIESTSDQLKLTYPSIASYIHEVHSNGDYSISKDSNERLRIDSSGNVGIGVSSPSTKLHLPNQSTIRFGNSAAAPKADISYSSTGFEFLDIKCQGTTNGYGNIRFYTGATPAERMLIDSSGRVGIGDDSPDALLVIKGNSDAATTPSIRLKDGTDTREAWITNSAGDLSLNVGGNDNVAHGTFKIFDSGILDFAQAAGSRLRIDSSGNVGIGQSSPSGRLEVNGGYVTLRNGASSFPDGVSAPIIYGSTGGGSGTFNETGNLVLQSRSDAGSYNICMVTGDTPTERLRVTSSGFVGIGTTSPQRKFVVSDAGAEGFEFYPGSSDTGNTLNHYDRGSSAFIDITTNADQHIFGRADGEKMRINSSGDVQARRARSNTSGDVALSIQPSDSTIHYGFRIDSANNNLNLDRADNNSTLLTVDASGNLGVGTSTPSMKVNISHADQDGLRFNSVANGETFIDFADPDDNDIGRISYDHSDNHMAFRANNVEHMRIASDGKISIGSTGDPSVVSTDDPKVRLMPGEVSVVNHQSSSLSLNRTGNNGSIAKFFRGGTQVGKITVDASSTSYVTSSDYRLKENVVELADGITRVKQLAPKRFNFIVDADTTVDGFLAHEAQAVVPEAVTGERDGEEMQGIDQSKLVPLLTAALQEAIAKIETLEQRLTDAGL